MVKKLIFWGICLLIALEVLIPNVDLINCKVFLSYLIIGILLSISAVYYLVKGDFYSKSILDLPIFLYFLWLFISYLFSPFKSSSGYSFLNNSVLIIFYFLLTNIIKKREEIAYLSDLWIFSALLVCLYAFLFQEKEIFGSFGNPNLFASFLVSAFPFCLVKFYETKERGLKFFYFTSLVIIFLSLYLTKSRAGIGAGIVSLVLFLGLGFHKEVIGSRKNLKRFYQILGLAIFLSIIFIQPILKFVALKDRIFIWQGALRLIKEKWLFGWGIGNFPVYFPRFSPPILRQIYPDQFVNNAHNEFLTLTSELGIIGLVLFLFILGRAFLLVKRNFRNEDKFIGLFNLGAFSSFVGILVLNLVDVSLRFLFTAIFFWLAIAIFAILNKLSREEILVKSFYPKRIFVSTVSLIISIILIKQTIYGFELSREYDKSVKQLRINLSEIERIKKEAEEKIAKNEADATVYFKLGTIYAKIMDWEKAKEYLEKAINLEPKKIFAYTNLGNVYAESNDWDKAIDCYQKAIEISSDYLNAHYNLGFAYFKKGDLEKALREFDLVLSKNRKDFLAWQMRQLIFE